MRLKLLNRINNSINDFKGKPIDEIKNISERLQAHIDFESVDLKNENILDLISLLIGKEKPLLGENNDKFKKVICGFGGLIGVAASYALLPAGKSAGRFLGYQIGLDDASTEALAQLIGWSGIISAGALMYHTTYDTFGKVCSFFVEKCGKKSNATDHSNTNLKSNKLHILGKYLLTLLFFGLAAASTIPRIELTLVESELSFALNMVVISTVFIAGFCKDYWGISGFYDVITSSKDERHEVLKMLNYMKEKIALMSNQHIEALYQHVTKNEAPLKVSNNPHRFMASKPIPINTSVNDDPIKKSAPGFAGEFV